MPAGAREMNDEAPELIRPLLALHGQPGKN